MEKSIYFVIPARKGSKGFLLKNRKLLDYTIKEIPRKIHQKTIISTDDKEIIRKVSDTQIKIIKRAPKLCGDKVSIRDVMKDVSKKCKLKDSDVIVMLYLTYPGRKFQEIKKILNYFLDNNIKTLLCSVEAKSHPYLCLYKRPNGKGKQIVKHDVYRRQDHPEVMEIRHYVCIFEVKQLKKLNKNMYNENTFFYEINNDIDIDYEIDFKKFKSGRP